LVIKYVIKAAAPIVQILLQIRTMPIASSILSRIFKLQKALLLPPLLNVSIVILFEDIIAVSKHEKEADKITKITMTTL
jgi:hypothetical protein